MRHFQRGIYVVIILLIGIGFVFPFGFTEIGRKTVNLQTVLISDFGDEYDKAHDIEWGANFSYFAPRIKDPQTGEEVVDKSYCDYKYFPGHPSGLLESIMVKQTNVFGIKAAYLRKGFNWIDIIPNKPIGFVGVTKTIDFWVWGGNYNWVMDIYVKDFKGYTYRIEAGSIKHIGWKNFLVSIPNYIPQYEPYVPFSKPLSLVKIRLTAAPTERADKFYVYFDYLQLQTDVYMERFDGDDLGKVAW